MSVDAGDLMPNEDEPEGEETGDEDAEDLRCEPHGGDTELLRRPPSPSLPFGG